MDLRNLSKSTRFKVALIFFLIVLNVISCDLFELFLFDEPPVAVITIENHYVRPKTYVQINGGNSYVPWGSPTLSYEWETLNTPDGSAIAGLNFEPHSTVAFTPDVVGQYKFKLTVSYKDRSGEALATIYVMDPPQTPAAPRVTTQSASAVQVEWDEVPTATGYSLKRNGLLVYSGNDLAFIDTNLTANTSYSYVLSAENQVGSSDDSPAGSASTTQMPPAVPANWEFTERTSTSMSLSWDEVYNATHYKVYRNMDDGSFTQKVYEGQNAQFKDTGLEPATTYYYRICASNGAGDGNYTPSITGRTRYMPLATPQNLRIDLSTTSSVRYIWDPVDQATGYRVEKSSTIDGPWVDPQLVSSPSHYREGMQAGEVLFVRVTALDSQNSDRDSDAAKLQIQTIPAAPQNVQLAVATSSAKAIVCSWNSVNGANRYQVFRGTSPYGPWGNPIAEPQSPGYEDTGLTSKTTYYYQVKAVNASGVSEASETKSILLTETDYYTVVANVSPTDGGYVTGAGDAIVGESITLRAYANSNFVFSHWDNNTNDTSSIKQITQNSTGTITHTAHFLKKKVNITVSSYPSGGGSVSGGGEYAIGEWVQLIATPASYYSFSHWDDNTSDRSNTKSFSAPSSNRSYVAHFTRNQGTVILKASPSNGGTVTGAGTYDAGSSITIEAQPAPNYQFSSWSDAKGQSHKITVAEGTKTYTATFDSIQPKYSMSVSNKTNPGQPYTNSDEISIQINRSGRTDSSNVTLDLRESNTVVKTIATTNVSSTKVVSYEIPNDVSAGTSRTYKIFLQDNDFSKATATFDNLVIYNVLDGNAKTRQIGMVPENTATTYKYLHDVLDWIDRKQPYEYLEFQNSKQPKIISRKSEDSH